MNTIKHFQAIIAAAGLLFLTSTPASAQTHKFKKFNFAIKAGATTPLNGNDDTSNKIGPQLGIEALWNLRKLPLQLFPIDIGAELYVGSAVRDYEMGSDLSHRTISLSAVADYNFHRDSNLAPFVGLGIGIAACQNVVGSYGNEYTSLCLTPRMGLVAFHHLRVTLDAHITKKNYSHAGLSIGYSF